VTVNRVFDADPIVRTVFDGTVEAADFTLCDGASADRQGYLHGHSQQQQAVDADGPRQRASGFASSQLGVSATKPRRLPSTDRAASPSPSTRTATCWALGPTDGDNMVARFPAAMLGASGPVEPDVSFNIPAITCVPALTSIAFDADGNLWLSSPCGGEVDRIAAADSQTAGDKVADVAISGLVAGNGLPDAEGIAFDHDGNLWVGGGAALRRFDAARLGDSSADPADLELSVKDSLAALVGNSLAFDKAGNLWATDFAANAVFEVAAADLGQTGSRTRSQSARSPSA